MMQPAIRTLAGLVLAVLAGVAHADAATKAQIAQYWDVRNAMVRPDLNRNGVRDDAEEAARKMYGPDSATGRNGWEAAVGFMAIIGDVAVWTDVSSQPEQQEFGRYFDALHCLRIHISEPEAAKKLAELVLDTPARQKKYERFAAMLKAADREQIPMRPGIQACSNSTTHEMPGIAQGHDMALRRLVGFDADRNGIRDNFEIGVEKDFGKDTPLARAVLNYARVAMFQVAFHAVLGDSTPMPKVIAAYEEAAHCMFEQLPKDHDKSYPIYKAIQDRLFDDEMRDDAWTQFFAATSVYEAKNGEVAINTECKGLR